MLPGESLSNKVTRPIRVKHCLCFKLAPLACHFRGITSFNTANASVAPLHNENHSHAYTTSLGPRTVGGRNDCETTMFFVP